MYFKKCKDNFKDTCIRSKICSNAWELITLNSGMWTKRINMAKGHKGLNCNDHILFKLIIGYIEVYYVILHIIY